MTPVSLARTGLRVACVATVAVFVLWLTASDGFTSSSDPIVYRGEVFGGQDDPVRLEQVDRRSAPDRWTFTVRRLDLVCEDGSIPVKSLDGLRLRPIGDDILAGQRYRGHPDAGWSYFEVRATLKARGQIRGYLYYTENGYDPPGSSVKPSCNTGSQLYLSWKASRAR